MKKTDRFLFKIELIVLHVLVSNEPFITGRVEVSQEHPLTWEEVSRWQVGWGGLVTVGHGRGCGGHAHSGRNVISGDLLSAGCSACESDYRRV